MAIGKKTGGRPFPKGNNLNPLGAGAHDKEKKQLKQLTEVQLKEIMTMILTADITSVSAVLKNPKSTTLQVWLASAAVKAINKGEVGPLQFLLDRLLGKVKDKVEHSVVNSYESMTDEQLNDEIAKLQPRNLSREVKPLNVSADKIAENKDS